MTSPNSTVYSLKSKVYSPKSTVYSLKSIVYSLKSIVYSLKSKVYSLKSKVYSLKSTVYSLKPIVYSLLLLATVIACDRRPLEVIVNEKARVRIKALWEVNYTPLYGGRPNGMTVMLWGTGSSQPIVMSTNADNVVVQLVPDTYRMILFNELAEEYAPYVNFLDAVSYDDMVARASTYRGDSLWEQGTTYMYTPEDPRIAVALDTFDITEDMVLQDTTIFFIPYEEYRDNNFTDKWSSSYTYEFPEVPWPMTVDLYVSVRVKHRQSLKSIQGNISGLADGFYFSRIVRTTESGTLRFNPDAWDRSKYGNEQDSMGVITQRLASFGLPCGKELVSERDSADCMLRFWLTLVNDSVVPCEFKVGKDIRYITPQGEEARIRYRQDLWNLQLIVELPDIIDLPPVNPPARGAGFNAWVDDWEDGGTFDIGGFTRRKRDY